MQVEQILIIQTAFFGDLLLCIPLIRRIRTLHPNAKIHLLVRKGLGDVLRPTGLVNQFHELHKQGFQTEVPKTLREIQFDLVFCPHQSVRSAWLVTKLKLKKPPTVHENERNIEPKQTFGFKAWWNGPVFDERVARPLQIPDALRQLSLLSPLDPEVAQLVEKAIADFAPGTSLFQNWGEEDSHWQIPDVASMSVKIQGPPVGKEDPIALAPGSVWATKRWPWERYAQLASKLIEAGHRVVLIGGREESAVGIEIQNLVPGVENWIGKTSLVELWDRLASCRALVCNDSGPMHMASALGVPTVSIFGPTTLDLGYRPWQNSVRVVQLELGCRPCGAHGSKTCPIGTHACMLGIPVVKVYDSLKGLLQRK
jgi:heptosyltransferase-2